MVITIETPSFTNINQDTLVATSTNVIIYLGNKAKIQEMTDKINAYKQRIKSLKVEMVGLRQETKSSEKFKASAFSLP